VKLGRAALAALAIGLALVAAAASPAAAHASLVSIDPADGARLDESPSQVTLTFSEHVSADLGGVEVLDSTGEAVHVGAARVSGAEVVVALQPDLPDGTYVVTFRVVSADGHPVRGGSVFGVGDVTVDDGALGRVEAGGSDRFWEVVGAIGRGLAYAGVLLAAGGAMFLALVHRDGDERASLERLVRAAAIVGAVASLVALPVQAALGTGQGPGSLFDDGVLGQVTRDGVGLGLALAVAGLAVLLATLRRSPLWSVGGGLVAAVSFATNGHTRAGDTSTLATIADASHLLAAATWGGGLVLLWSTLRARRRAGAADADPAATTELIGRFSTLATVTVLLVGMSGIALSWSEVRTLDGLTGTTYGRLVLAKVAVVLVIGGMGAYNHFRLLPALRAGKAKAALTHLRTTVRIEALALVAVVAITAVLVVVTPARTQAEGGVVERTVLLGEAGSVQLTISPAKAGFNQIHLYLFDPDGRPDDIAETITLQLSLPSADLGPIEREAVRAGPAHLQLDGSDLALGGTWTIEVHARIDRFTEASGSVEIPVAG
jgi:copper transport protein